MPILIKIENRIPWQQHWAPCPTSSWKAVLCVIRHQSRLTISLWAAPLQGNSGFISFSQVGLRTFSPQFSDTSFFDWWERASNDISGCLLQGFNSLTILGAWTIWTQRNRCVFDGASPDVARALTLASEERKLWSMSGAQGISFLIAPTSVD